MKKNLPILVRWLFYASCFCSVVVLMDSCASANRIYAHGGKVPFYVNNSSDTYYVDGKEIKVYLDEKSHTVNYYDHYNYTTVVQDIKFAYALRIPGNRKFITIEEVSSDGTKLLILCRRKPLYAYFWFDQFLTADVGTIIDIADNMIYDWEIISITEEK